MTRECQLQSAASALPCSAAITGSSAPSVRTSRPGPGGGQRQRPPNCAPATALKLPPPRMTSALSIRIRGRALERVHESRAHALGQGVHRRVLDDGHRNFPVPRERDPVAHMPGRKIARGSVKRRAARPCPGRAG